MGELGADRPMTEVELRQKVIALEAEVKVLRATVVGLTKQVNRYLDEKEFHDACQAYRHTPSLG